MAQKLTEEEIKEALIQLKTSYDMYERSKEQTIESKKKMGASDKEIRDVVSLMETMQKDIMSKYTALGGSEEELKQKSKKKSNKKDIVNKINEINQKDEMREYAKKLSNSFKSNKTEKTIQPSVPASAPINETIPVNAVQQAPNTIGSNFDRNYNVSGEKVNYDTVNLPSKGECYPSKKSDIMVSHLCAYDENMIMSLNLYRNGTFLDHLLKNKVIDNIDPDDLVQGDRDAIIIWLRASGYGDKYEVEVNDDITGKKFKSHINLSELKYKNFTLKGDENGYFDFTMPVTGDVVKFKFLTGKDIKRLDKMRADESKEIKLTTFKKQLEEMKESLENNNAITYSQSESLVSKLNQIEGELTDVLKSSEETYFTHDLTNRLIISTVSINGNSDIEYIAEYISNMNLQDASAYRKYIIDNEPGIDYHVRIKKPGGEGSGHLETFLRLDQFIFLSAIQ